MNSIAGLPEKAKKSGLTAAVRFDEPLKNHTTFKIGGPVRAMFFPAEAADAVKLIEILRSCGITSYILGKGSNILADDKALDIVVINTTAMNDIHVSGSVIRASGGALLRGIADTACRHSLSGLEFAHGIPGTLGGAVFMNAGAYDGQMKDVVCSTTAYSSDKGEYTITGNKHGFSYRESVFMHNNDIILSSELRLKKGDKAQIEQEIAQLSQRRKDSQPLDRPSAGSTFKRPENAYAAQLIEQAGLKGFAIGGAQVSPKHSGFIVNNGEASYSDVMRLIEHVRETVLKETGIKLELEVKVWKS